MSTAPAWRPLPPETSLLAVPSTQMAGHTLLPPALLGLHDQALASVSSLPPVRLGALGGFKLPSLPSALYCLCFKSCGFYSSFLCPPVLCGASLSEETRAARVGQGGGGKGQVWPSSALSSPELVWTDGWQPRGQECPEGGPHPGEGDGEGSCWD